MNELISLRDYGLQETDRSYTPQGGVFLSSVISVFALSECATNKRNLVYWSTGTNLSKHRSTREFDEHVQKMLLYLGRIGNFEASEVQCGNNGYTRTELKSILNKSCVHVLHTFDPKASYLSKYLSMNADYENPKFAVIKYDLNRDKSGIGKIFFSIPTLEGKLSTVFDLTQAYVAKRNAIHANNDFEINDELESLKNQLKVDHRILSVQIGN